MDAVKDINSNEFEKEVEASDVPVLVDFWAPWCKPCIMMSKVLVGLTEHYGNRLKIVKVNVDENSGLANRFGVMSIPTLKVFKAGAEVESIIGAQKQPDLIAIIDRHL